MPIRRRFGALAALLLTAFGAVACGGASVKGQASVSAGAAGNSGSGGPGDAQSSAGGGDRSGEEAQAPGPPNGPVPEDQGLGAAPGGVAVASLPGFRVLPDGRSLVSLEVSGRVPVTQSTAAGRINYHLPGVRVPVRTNRFDLPTDYFASPVARVRLLAADDGANLVIELRAPAKPTARLQQSGRGVVLRVELPRADTVRVPEATVLDKPAADEAQPDKTP